MDAKQVADRAQFRRYAEAALAGTFGLDSLNAARTAFSIATSMMLIEDDAFEEYQLRATQRAINEERKRQGIEPPYSDPS